VDLFSAIQYVLFIVIVTALVTPLGRYMERVFSRKRTVLDRLCLPVKERRVLLPNVVKCLLLHLAPAGGVFELINLLGGVHLIWDRVSELVERTADRVALREASRAFCDMNMRGSRPAKNP
jgi:hypothetical protein